MIGRRLRDAAQLSNTAHFRAITASAFAIAVVAVTVVVASVSINDPQSRRDDIVVVVYLVVASIVLSAVDVRLERGRLTLTGIPLGVAAILLNPLDAALVGLSVGITMARRGAWPILGNAALASTYACFGALLASHLRSDGDVSLTSRLAVLAVVNVSSWILVGIGFVLRTGESVRSIVARNFTAQFYAAFGYFALASLLTSYVLDGSVRGYVLSTIVFVLALALTDTIAGRRLRRILESELTDADRHLFHSRAVEGVVHNLRNHIATAVGYLKEIDTNKLEPVDRDAVETAKAAANDAVVVLHGLSQGATPRVTYATEPVDLNQLVSLALDMARPRARTKRVELRLQETPDDVKVRADPLLLREVATNLVNNAIDAAPQTGHVLIATGRRNGSPYFSVADNGSGVTEENRHHLFEPHFTTKEHGTGLGLFMSYGVVREHQGELTYSGSSRGAVFTVTLPPFAR
jgi:signal transduction histidine kinase